VRQEGEQKRTAVPIPENRAAI